MNPYTHPTAQREELSPEPVLLSVFQLGTMLSSAAAMIVGTGYVILYPNPNSISWERQLEIAAMVGLWILYLTVSVIGGFLLIRSRGRIRRSIGVLVAALPAFIVCGGFISMLFA